MLLDLRSLNIMAGINSMVMGLVLLGMWRSLPTRVAGLRWWGMAPLLCTASTLVYGLDGHVPALVVVLLGNALLLGGTACFYFGSQAFYAQPCSWRRWLPWGLAVLATLVFFLHGYPDYRVRVIVFTLALAAAIAPHIALLWLQGQGFAARLVLAILALQTLMLLLRAATTFWLDGAHTQRFAPSTLQMAYLATFHLGILLVSIGVTLMASERVRSEFQLLATRDSLTGAHSRHAIFQEGEQAWARWQQTGEPFSLLLLDLDHFKRINDGWGHPMGDQVLKDFARRCAARLRGADRLGRYGGEEFLVVLPGADAASALASARRLHQAARLPASPSHPGCSVSLGVATVQPNAPDLNGLLARADAQLYRAKEQGRDQVCTA